jgi:superfamily I DNA and/or RNA helicase
MNWGVYISLLGGGIVLSGFLAVTYQFSPLWAVLGSLLLAGFLVAMTERTDLANSLVVAKRSMGVIVLRYGAQGGLIEDLIDVRLDTAVREHHNIKVGTPEHFQGDQRDVILLSMVVDGDNARAATGRGDQRRFNVAASRARDQMWLFHSVTPDQLSSKDLRRSPR